MMESIDLFTREMQRDPHQTYRLLREQAPVYREPRFNSWVLTRFDDVYHALRDWETFSSAQGIAPGFRGDGFGRIVLITTDPPRHHRLRAIVNKAFTPRMVARLDLMMRDTVDSLLAGVDHDQPVDLPPALTIPLPVIVIAHLLGIPKADRQRFKHWSDAVVGLTDTGVRDGTQSALIEMYAYFSGHIAWRRTQFSDDLIAALVAAEIDGEHLSEQELLGFCLLLLVAGNETTTNLISNALNVLVDRPDLWQRLRADRSLVPKAIEETLRFDGPVSGLWRTATRPVELNNVAIAAGDKVMVCYAAANRDPAEFPDPDQFLLDRELERHVAFGYGIHYCLGAPLARAEAAVALNALLDRYPAIERGDEPAERLPSTLLRGFGKLPLMLRR